jgi:hypothetical protein
MALQSAWVAQPGVIVQDAGSARWRIIDPVSSAAHRFVRARLEM